MVAIGHRLGSPCTRRLNVPGERADSKPGVMVQYNLVSKYSHLHN